MSPTFHNPRFLGLDLQALRQEFRAAWSRMQRWPVLAFFSPVFPVRLLGADGGETVWSVDDARIDGSAKTSALPAPVFTAVELPENSFLLRRLLLPPLSEGELAEAVSLDVAGANPFPPEDVVWGFQSREIAPGKIEIHAALASRRQVMNYLQTVSGQLPQSPPEVWAVAGAFIPIVFAGFGETRRVTQAAARRRFALALLLLALALVTFIAVTPVAQQRLRALEAVNAFDSLTKKADPVLKQRAQLVRMAETAGSLKEILALRSDPLFVLDLLTQALPDDTSLMSLQVQGAKVTINGSTGDAAALMQRLSVRPEFRDVKAPTAATRPLGASKDSFSIELTLVPLALPVASSGGQVPAAASGSGGFVSPFGDGTPVSAAQPPPAQPPGANAGGASFGGSAGSTVPSGKTP